MERRWACPSDEAILVKGTSHHKHVSTIFRLFSERIEELSELRNWCGSD